MRFGKIVCDPTSEEAKALIGKKVATCNVYSKLKEKPEECYMGILNDTSEYISVYNKGHYIDVYDHVPFKLENEYGDRYYAYCATFIREVIEGEDE